MENFLNPLNLELFGQVMLAAILGAFIGIERRLARKGAGMRTFAFVSLGSALFSIISIHALDFISTPNTVSFDPTRIASGIVTGVGFIGAGIIIFAQSKFHGVTTAASLWFSAAIGMTVGFKFYALAVFTTFFALAILTLFWFIEDKIIDKFSINKSPDDEEP